MDNHQIWSLILLATIAITLIGLLVVIYKATVRRDLATEAQHKLLNRLIEIEASMKATLPAIERNTGATDKRLSEALPAIEKAVVGSAAEIVQRLPAVQESMLAAERAVTASAPNMARIAELAEATSEKAATTSGQSAERLHVLVAGVEQILVQMAKNADAGAKKSETMTAEIASLRKDLAEAVKF